MNKKLPRRNFPWWVFAGFVSQNITTMAADCIPQHTKMWLKLPDIFLPPNEKRKMAEGVLGNKIFGGVYVHL